MFGAGDDGFLASGVPLGEGLWPVCFDGFDEAVSEGFAFEFDGEFECAVDEDWGVRAEAFVRVASVRCERTEWSYRSEPRYREWQRGIM